MNDFFCEKTGFIGYRWGGILFFLFTFKNIKINLFNNLFGFIFVLYLLLITVRYLVSCHYIK